MEADTEAEAFQKCQHVCLFCLSRLPPGYDMITSREVVSYGVRLTTSLDNPTKNSEAFELLCARLGVKWRKSSREKDGLRFDGTRILPLCDKCQSLYQEMFQLHDQIRQLEELLRKHSVVIRDIIEKSARKRRSRTQFGMGGTQLILFGLDVFRKSVINPEEYMGRDDLTTKKQSHSLSDRRSANVTTAPEISNSKSVITSSHQIDSIKQEVPTLSDHSDYEHEGDNASLEGTHSEHSWIDSDEVDLKPSTRHDNMEQSMDTNNDFDDDMNEIYNSESEDEVRTKSQTRSRKPVKQNKTTIDYISEELDKISDNEKDSDPDFEINKSSRKRGYTREIHSTSLRSLPNKSKKQKHNSETSAKKVTIFTCHLCSATETSRPAFREHYNVHHPDEIRFSCKFCKKHFKHILDCIVHQRSHTNEKPYKCPSCPTAFTGKSALNSHIVRKHSGQADDKTFPCSECEKIFPSLSILNNHLNAIHDHPRQKLDRNRRTGKPIRTFTCNLCEKTFTGIGPFFQHYTDLHPGEKRYTCKYCKKIFPALSTVRIHQRTHTGEKPFPCQLCTKTFHYSRALLLHQRNMHKPHELRFECDKCGKKVATESALKSHKLDRHSESLYFCKSCGKGFRSVQYFNRHNKKVHKWQAQHSEPVSDLASTSPQTLSETLGIPDVKIRTKCHVCWTPIPGKELLQKHFDEKHPDHEGGLNTCSCGKEFNSYTECCKHAVRHSTYKTFQCDQCPLSFITANELRLHSHRHLPLEERQIVCDICGLKIVTPAAMVAHKRKHEENPTRWVCEDCGKSYAENRGLQHHRRMEHLKIFPHKCTYCGKGFALPGTLAKHITIHTGDKRYKCQYCEKRFPYPTTRARHLREVHGLDGTVAKGPTPRKRKTMKKSTSGEMEGKSLTGHFGGGVHEAGMIKYSMQSYQQTQHSTESISDEMEVKPLLE